ncbi:MAG: S41 family peptidase [Candidatus Hodarchaeota archaeon]
MYLNNHKILYFIILFFISSQISQSQAVGSRDIRSDIKLDSKTKSDVIRDINELLIEKYIFLDVAEEMQNYLNTKLTNGDYDKIDDPIHFANVVRADLYEISKDNHFYLEFNPERVKLIKAQKSKSEEEVEKTNRKIFEADRIINFGFKKVEHLKGNIGYLDLRLFCNAEYAGETAVAAMNLLANSDAVIIDLRDTPGGYPNMVQLLCSYFVKGTQEGRTHLNTFERRYANSIEQFWTISYVPGKRMYDTDLYILTSQYTGSGAEEFTYNMKHLKRAIIVGEKTRGSANPVDYEIIQDKFVMHLPTGRPVNPISKTNWEQIGIEPDIAVPVDQALDKAYLMALEKILKEVEDKGQKFQVNWVVDDLRAKLNPVKVDEEILKKYVGQYGERKITFEDGELFYQRTGPKYRLIPLKENVFKPEGLNYFRIEIVVDKKGNATELVGVYDDGTRDPSERTK